MRTSILLAALALPVAFAGEAAAGPDAPLTGARAIDRAPVGVGVRVGGAFTALGGEATLDVNSFALEPAVEISQGLVAGGFVSLAITPRLGARVEALYSQRGALIQGSVPDARLPYEYEYALDYLAVPIVATYDIPYDGAIAPQLFAGAELAWLARARLRSDPITVPTFDEAGMPTGMRTIDPAADLDDELASFDAGVVAGAAVRLPARFGSVLLDVRYFHALTEVADQLDVVAYQDTDATVTAYSSNHRNKALTVSIGFAL